MEDQLGTTPEYLLCKSNYYSLLSFLHDGVLWCLRKDPCVDELANKENGVTKRRVEKLHKLLPRQSLLDDQQCDQLFEFLITHHLAFCLKEYERGETDMIEMEIDTGDAHPKKLPPRRMPFAVRQEVATQLRKMQETGVVQPSRSPWSSPVVMVRKKDGPYQFCIDYRELNKSTKADTFPLPRIDDILNQLGNSHYFLTLDLASSYWQICMAPSSREKTAFSTPQGLYEFWIMPFGLTNAPAVF